MREALANRYLAGKGGGIEIGALHFPLPVPGGCKVTYVDLAPAESLQEKFPEVQVKQNPVIVDNAETLATIQDGSQDFVIANHVFEHCEDPLGTLENWLRVLRPGGVIYAAIPNKDHTFDRYRAVTPLSHVQLEYAIGTDHSLRSHYEDWYANSALEGLAGDKLSAAVEAAMAARANIHFHVWDLAAIGELFSWAQAKFNISALHIYPNGAEVIVICEK